MVGEILKSDVQKEDDAAPPFSLWDSCFYKSWKADRAMIHPLEENWQHLLGIFRNLRLRWQKRHHIRSWIAFGKRYQISYHITNKTWIKGRSVTNINQYREVETQKVYQCYGNGRGGYISWFIQRRGSIPILKDFYLTRRDCMKRIANCSWWEWDAGSSLLLWKWPQQYQ